MKVVSTFIVWDEDTIQHVKIHYCLGGNGTERYFMERHTGRLELLNDDEAIGLINQ
jgi:hypothetical protein